MPNSSVSLSSFPSDRRDALAMLYMQNQDLSGKTPEEIAAMYDDAYSKISEKLDERRREIAAKKREQRKNLAF